MIGARDFLVAYNVNLNTKSVRRANAVAFDVREQGRVKTEDGTPSGKPVLDANGEPVRIPGMLKHVKANRLVCEGIWHRAGFDESDEH